MKRRKDKRVLTSVRINVHLRDLARMRHINLSRTLEEALISKLNIPITTDAREQRLTEAVTKDLGS